MSKILLRGDFRELWSKNWRENLFAPVDISSIILFRIAFGGIMLWEVTRYFKYNWIYRYWVEPAFNFSYGPFNFQPLPEQWMYLLWYALGTLAVFIAIGFLYRISTVLFFLGFTYTFLLEQGRYLNHFYLVVLISFILIFIPANRYFSIDALLWKSKKSALIESWCLWLVRFLIGVPYFFGAVAKINPDWLQGYPLKLWLSGDTDFPIIGQFFTEYWMILFMSYSGLLLDLLVVPALLFKRTRLPAYFIITLFHLMNAEMFSIGIFPWFMMLATTIYFSPDWPRKLFNKLSPKPTQLGSQALAAFNQLQNPKWHRFTTICLSSFVALQVFLPLRHWLIPGNVHWTEEGHRYSWHMKLRSKSGATQFFVRNNANGELITVNLDGYIEPWQINDMDGKPYMIWNFAQFLKEEYKLMGADVGVFVEAHASLNGRQYQRIIDRNVDLTTVSLPLFTYADWIIPLEVELEQQR
ncbi:HTTM domain-containing protein [Roseivirga pacifica]